MAHTRISQIICRSEFTLRAEKFTQDLLISRTKTTGNTGQFQWKSLLAETFLRSYAALTPAGGPFGPRGISCAKEATLLAIPRYGAPGYHTPSTGRGHRALAQASRPVRPISLISTTNQLFFNQSTLKIPSISKGFRATQISSSSKNLCTNKASIQQITTK